MAHQSVSRWRSGWPGITPASPRPALPAIGQYPLAAAIPSGADPGPTEVDRHVLVGQATVITMALGRSSLPLRSMCMGLSARTSDPS